MSDSSQQDLGASATESESKTRERSMVRRLFRWASSRLDGSFQPSTRLEFADLRNRFQEQRDPVLIDLSDEPGVTFKLMDEPLAWRERAVHEISLRDSDHVDASVTYQICIPLGLVRPYEPTAQIGDRVRLLLPFAARPKRLLVNVGLEGAEENPASLILKRDATRLQAGYMSHVDGRPQEEQPLHGALWRGVSAYTPWAWREHYVGLMRRIRNPRWLVSGHPWRTEALARYLEADLELGITAQHVAKWLSETEESRIALVDALGEGEDPESASECILLAIPYMTVRPEATADIDILVAEFSTAVKTMHPRARRTLAELGRRWQLMIDTTLPIGRPCTVELFEQRPWLNSPSPRLVQEIAIADATATHVEIRAADHSVVLRRLRVSDFAGEPVDVWVSEDARATADAVSLYVNAKTAPDVVEALYPDTRAAPGVVRVGVRAQPRWTHRRPILWLQVLIVMAGITMISLPESSHQFVESLALLTFPLTLAGVVVLAREATSLAERLLSRSRILLMLSIAALWAIALSRLLLKADVKWAESVSKWASDLLAWIRLALH